MTAIHPITPHETYPELTQALAGTTTPPFSEVYLKREDLHPLGSHKGRSIPKMIDAGIADGVIEFAIASSGNAALAAGRYVKELNTERQRASLSPITLDILIGEKIAPHKRDKLDALKDDHIRVSASERPLQALFAKTEGKPAVRSLRQSNDDTALVGYASLAQELLLIPNLRAVFVGTSSGTTAQALANYFLKHAQKVHRKPIEVHIVQTSSCHPISLALGSDTNVTGNDSERSIADAIVDHTALRTRTLVPQIEMTDGAGWVATNESILTAQDVVRKHTGGLVVSPNSALSVVGLMHAIYTDRNWDGSVACLVCGD